MIKSLLVAAVLVAANVVYAQEADVEIFSLRRDVALGKKMSDAVLAAVIAHSDVELVRSCTASLVVQLITIAKDQISVRYWLAGTGGEANLTDSERTAYGDSCDIVRGDIVPTFQTIGNLMKEKQEYAQDEVIQGAFARLKEYQEATKAKYPDLFSAQ
jgi:hypothetical protein